jgi:hypothetical protein
MGELKLTDIEKTESPANNPLGNIMTMVNQFKEVLTLVKSIQGQPLNIAGNTLIEHTSGNDKTSLASILKLIEVSGFGDIPIGKILNELSPHTINELRTNGVKLLENQSRK